MPLSASRLKNLDYKQILIDHGEKFGMTLIALIAAWALLGTNWKQFAGSPTGLVADAEKAKETIASRPWPAEEQKRIQTGGDLLVKVKDLLTPITSNLRLIGFYHPLHPEKRRITRPRFFAVEDLIADSGWANLQMSDNVKPLNEGFVKKPKKDDQKEKDKKKDKKTPAKKDKDNEKVVPPELRPKNSVGGRGSLSKMALARGRDKGDKPFRKGRGSAAGDATDDADAVAATTVAPKHVTVGHGYHFVAIRGVFPLQKEVQELIRVRGDAATANVRQVQDQIDLDYFILERQTKKSGSDPWSGTWERVDTDFAIELLRNEINNTVPETMADGIINSAICMPLPERIVGDWDKCATHPKVEKFKLSDEEVEEQVEFQERLIEKLHDEEEKKRGPSHKTFGDVTRDMHYLRTRAAQTGIGQFVGTTSIQDQIVEDMSHGKSNPDEIKKQLREFIDKTSSALNHYLLFRFLDLTVEPGQEYRYRVKLVLENPFHNVPVADVEDPSLTIPDRVETEYSEPTQPVVVKDDAEFFLTHVDPKVGKSSLATAKLDLYEWFKSTGTCVNKSMLTQLGEFIGKKGDAFVLRPAEDTFEMETVPFGTNDALVDVAPGFSLDPTLHDDILKEISGPASKKATVPSQAVIVKGDGSLARLDDGIEQKKEQQNVKEYFGAQNQPYEKLREPKDEDEGLGSLADKLNKHKHGKKHKHRKDPRRLVKGKK
jgi:hypothetical protein